MTEPAPASNRWLIAIAVSTGALLEIVDTSIVNVALRDMQAQMGASLSAIGWVVTSYAVANVIILPLAAWLGDTFGKKRYFLFSLVAFTIASMMCGMANSLQMLVVCRVLQGLFGGGLLAKAQSILFETFPREEQAKAQGLFGAVVIAGPAIGPTLGGFLVDNLSWRWIFFVNLPVGILASLMVFFALPNDKPFAGFKKSVDWLCLLGLAVGLGSFQTVLEEGQTEDWFGSNLIRACTATTIVGAGLFLWRSLRSAEPLVDLRVLRHRSLWTGCIMTMIVGVAIYGANFAVPIFAQNIMGYTAQQTGMLLFPGAVMSAVGMAIASMLVARIDIRLVILLGITITSCTTYELIFLAPATNHDSLFWPILIRGIGIPMMFLPVNMAALGTLPKKDLPAATGLFNLMRQLGGSMGIAALTTAVDRRAAFHRSILSSSMGATDLGPTERVAQLTHQFVSEGFDANLAHTKALASLDGMLQGQSTILAFGDTFVMTLIVFLCMVPMLLLLGPTKPGTKVSLGH